jgi:hypothetical protein
MSACPVTGIVGGLACLAVGMATTSLVGTSYAASGRHQLPTHVNSCWSTDNGTPVLDSFTTTTQSVDVTDGPATVGVTVHAHDVGGPGPAHPLGDRLTLQVYTPDALNTDNTNVQMIRLVKTLPGTWTGSWTTPHNAPAAPFHFDQLALTPSQGARAILDVNRLGPDATIHVTSAHPDTTPPEITDFGITPDPVDVSHGAGRVQVNATVSDETGVSAVSVRVGKRWVSLQPGSTPDQYTGAFTVRRWERRENLPLQVAAADVNRVFTTVTSAELADAGLPSTLTVRGSHPDHRKPRVHLSLSTHRLRLHPGGWLNVRVHASDAGSGIDSISLAGLGLPTPGMFVPNSRMHPFHRISGTRHDGIWGAHIHVRCLSAPRVSRLHVHVRDRAGNETTTPRQAVRITGPDRLPPEGDDLSGGGIGHATVTFSEPVHGISTAGVTVSDNAGSPVLTGTWQCWARRFAGASTSCLHGHVLSATFTATDPNAEITLMDFAPSGHLDVLDRAGNPLIVKSDAND